MGSVFAVPLLRAEVAATPPPRAALTARGGEEPGALSSASTLCLGAEREGLPASVLAECELRVTIPLRPGGPDSLNVAAAAAIALERVASAANGISSPAMQEAAE